MSPSEAHVRATVDAMVAQGLVAVGYRWLNLDDGIVEVERDANGDLVPDKTGFPNGFGPVAEYIKANGMQFGVYTDRGPKTCGGLVSGGGTTLLSGRKLSRTNLAASQFEPPAQCASLSLSLIFFAGARALLAWSRKTPPFTRAMALPI